MTAQPSQQLILDASAIIDLYLGDALGTFLETPYRFAAPDQIIAELLDPAGEVVVMMGVSRVALSSAQVLESLALKSQYPRLSSGDAQAFLLARDADAMLLTGDRLLRFLAENAGVVVHGVLWALDQIEAAGLMAGPALAASLRKMLEEGARLPDDGVEERLTRWERS